MVAGSAFGTPSVIPRQRPADNDCKDKGTVLRELRNLTSGQRARRLHLGKVNASLLGVYPNNRCRFRKKLLPREIWK